VSVRAEVRVAEPRPLALRLRLALPRADQALFALLPLWAIILGTIALERHSTFRTHRFDLGDMVQAVRNTAHGHFLEVTLGDGRQASRLASHADPLLALLAPLWWIWSDPRMLQVVQVLALASAAIPIFRLAEKYTGSRGIALRLSLAYLLFPTTLWNAVIDFHPVSLAVPLVAFGIWFLENDRLLPFLGCAVVAGMAKEQYPLMLGLLALGYAIRRRRFAFGLTAFAAGTAWTLVNVLVLIPHFNHGTSAFMDRYVALGSSPAAVARALVVHPLRVLEAATQVGDLRYLALFAIPLLGLFLRAPLIALAVAPQLALNLTSSFGAMNELPYQYALGVVAILFPAAAVGIGRLAPQRARVASIGVLAVVAVAGLTLGPQVGEGKYLFDIPPTKAHLAAERAAAAAIPPNVSVSVTNQLGGHLSARRYVYSFPIIRRAEWVAVDVEDPYLAEDWRPKIFRRAVASFVRNDRWRLVCGSSGVFVFERRAQASPRRPVRTLAAVKATATPCRR
jgi:uncharacterized membrane protein